MVFGNRAECLFGNADPRSMNGLLPKRLGRRRFDRAEVTGLLVVFVLVLVVVAIGGIIVVPVIVLRGSHFGHLPRAEVEDQR